MIYFISFLIVIIICLGLYAFFLTNSGRLSRIETEKRILEARNKELEAEKKILLKHAKDARQKTIEDEKELQDAKNKYFNKVGGRDIDAVMDYITNG